MADPSAPFGLFADLNSQHGSINPTQPTVGDYLSDMLASWGVPREQANKLGSAFGFVPQGMRESGRAMALPVAEPTAGNIAGAGVEAALMAAPFGIGKVAKHLGKAITPSRDEVMAEALHRADPWGGTAYPELGVNYAQDLQSAAKTGRLKFDPFLAIANDRKLGITR
jgi:hypothetical protein